MSRPHGRPRARHAACIRSAELAGAALDRKLDRTVVHLNLLPPDGWSGIREFHRQHASQPPWPDAREPRAAMPAAPPYA
jgi:hypothetical protein